MKLLANENFPLTSVQFLRSKGHDVLFVGEDFPGISDEEVLEVALKEKRTILTFDRDYGELIFKYQKRLPKGVLYLRLETFDPMEPGLLVEQIISKKKLKFDFALTVLDKTGIRQRKY